jgi:soluble lytic murein transglycosylase
MLSSARLFAGGLYYYVDDNGVYHFSDTRREKFDKMIIWPDNSSQSIKVDLTINFDDYIRQACGTYDVDENLIRAMIKVESNYDPTALSKKGAQGLMQLMPQTAQAMRLIDPWHPRDNIFAGVAYFRALLDKYNDEKLALAAYNAGPGAVDKYGGVPPYTETRNYVRKVQDIRDKYAGRNPSPGQYRSHVIIISERVVKK